MPEIAWQPPAGKMAASGEAAIIAIPEPQPQPNWRAIMTTANRYTQGRTAIPFSLLLAALLLLQSGPGFAGRGNGNGAYQACPAIVAATAPTAGEAEHLAFMREEEKLARDVYLALYQKWQQPVFNNIAQSEQSHMDQIKCFLDAYGLPDSASGEAGRFNNTTLQGLYDSLAARGQTSPGEALLVGGMIEEVDIRDLQTARDQTTIPEVKTLYGNLLAGSAKHLRAFAANLGALGKSYIAQVLPESSVTATLSDDPSVPGSAIDIVGGKPLLTQARFTLLLQSGVAVPAEEIPLTQQSRLTLSAAIQVDPAHVGQTAQLVNVMQFQAYGQRAASVYQLTAQNAWQQWNGDLGSLQGSPVQLQASHQQVLHSGNFENMAGYFQVYCGYLLGDGSLIVSSSPLSFGIQP
jgi:hypothetical protein